MTPQEWQEIEEVLAAAVEVPEDQQGDYLASVCGQRPWIWAEVEAFLSIRDQANAAFASPPEISWVEILSEPAPVIDQKLGPYRVIRVLGIGGMGEVYLAERDDDQFHRQVAVKMIAGSIASPELLARFRAEREILATLDHPNIARLLDAGISASGRPFLIMEYVDGMPLLEFCQDRRLDLRARLELFCAICSAVQFAHQNLIVHRDLKPGNILVTAEGTPKLLDFGIAKMLAAPRGAPTLTLLSAQPMTPDYASPEQLRGAAMTTATDIYSLGALLYELLTAARPFQLKGSRLEEAARLIADTPTPKPSAAGGARRRQLEGDLDAIILKALRSEPRDRFGSVEELSSDIGRYLSGLPVLARRGTFQYVARKFVARHRAAVAASATAVGLLVAGGVALAHSARVAELERAKSQERFDQVRQLVNSLLFEFHDDVATLPGADNTRKKLVARALQYLEALEKTAPGDPALLLDLAQSYERLGSVQGHLSELNLGDPRGALASYGRGIETLQRVPSGAPQRTAILKELAQLHLLRGDVYRDLRDARARDREYEQVLAILEPLAARFPDDEGIRTRYSSVLFGLAKGQSAESPAAARELFLRSLAIDDKTFQAHPDDWKSKRNLALDYKYLSSVAPSHQEALDYLEKARALDEKRVAAQPDNQQARLDLSYDLSELASHLVETGDLPRALGLSRQVQSIREELEAADPRDAQIRLRVVTAGKGVAVVLARMGRLEAALAEYRAAAERAEAAIAAVPGDPRNREVLGEIELGIGSVEERVAARSPAAAEHRRNSCHAYARVAEVLGVLVSEGVATGPEASLAKEASRAAATCGTR
jgi:non-specific serine/threonine protein kinase/serine/threonine-protein kinase